ncbi:MAG: alpha/beta fold hydrolase [Acidimicrobiia bacterium]|nr:alpha/beta fold hydrolase [Acidimicrobiia bacterium]
MWAGYASLTDPHSRRAFARTLRAVVDPSGQAVSARDRLYLAEAVPTLLVWGDEDRVIPVEHAYDTHDDMPGSRLEIFEGVGHFPHVEASERFAEVLLDFVASTPAARPDPTALRRLLLDRPSTADTADTVDTAESA